VEPSTHNPNPLIEKQKKVAVHTIILPLLRSRLDPMETTTTFIFGHPLEKEEGVLPQAVPRCTPHTKQSRGGHAVGHAVEPCTRTPNP